LSAFVCRGLLSSICGAHGSDAEDTAAFEIGYFFAGLELV
jgi:hypothetical protein